MLKQRQGRCAVASHWEGQDLLHGSSRDRQLQDRQAADFWAVQLECPGRGRLVVPWACHQGGWALLSGVNGKVMVAAPEQDTDLWGLSSLNVAELQLLRAQRPVGHHTSFSNASEQCLGSYVH